MRKIKKGDKVEIMRGKESGKRGVVLKVVLDKSLKQTREFVVVDGINKVKKAQKPNPRLGIKGGFVEFEKPIDISNVMLVDPKLDKPTRVGFKIDDVSKKKIRYAKKSGERLD